MRPCYQDLGATLYCMDFRENDLYQNRIGRAGIIEGFDLIKQGLSQLDVFRVGVSTRSADVFGLFLVLSQLKKYLRLPRFYPQVTEHSLNTNDSLLIANFPTIKRLTIPSRWFLDSCVTTKGLLEEFNNFRSYLLQAYAFLKGRIVHIATLAYAIGATLDGKVTIAIKATSQIGTSLQSDFSLYLPYGFAHISIIPHHRKLWQGGGDDNDGEVLRRPSYYAL